MDNPETLGQHVWLFACVQHYAPFDLLPIAKYFEHKYYPIEDEL